MCCMAFVLDGKGCMPVALKMCPRYWISLEKKLHLLIFMDSLADLIHLLGYYLCIHNE